MEKGLAMLTDHRPKAPTGNRQDVPLNIPNAITTNAGGVQGDWTASHRQNLLVPLSEIKTGLDTPSKHILQNFSHSIAYCTVT